MTKINDDTLRTFVGYHLKRSFNVIQSDLIETLRPFDLRMLTYSAGLIVDNPGLNQSRLSQIMDIERPNLVVIIDELEERELITRTRTNGPPSNRAGRALYRETLDAVTQQRGQIVIGDRARELEQMIATLKLIEPQKRDRRDEAYLKL